MQSDKEFIEEFRRTYGKAYNRMVMLADRGLVAQEKLRKVEDLVGVQKLGDDCAQEASPCLACQIVEILSYD